MALKNHFQNRSLQELENLSVKDIPGNSSVLVNKCIDLLQIPINQFSVENLRLMIGQQFGLVYLIPLAMEKLKDDILAEGDLYAGDLLSAVLNIDHTFWKQNNALFITMKQLVADNREAIIEERISLKKFEDN